MSSSIPDPRRWWALGLIAIAQFLVIMDTSIIGVALPEIQGALGFSQSELSWVFNAYVIAFGGLLLLGGRLSDIHGPRRIFALGFAILGGASLLTGLAGSPEVLLIGRALQGVGSALIAPAALTLLMMLFSHDGKELTRAFALYGAAAPAGGTAGVFLGGLLTDWLDWRWVFLVNVPVALVVLALVRRLLPENMSRRGSLDVLGAVSVTGALSLAVLGIVRAPEVGWTSAETLLTLGAAAVLLGLFLVLQARRREPLMPLSIWRTPDLAVANIAMALLGAAWVPAWFFLNLYLQQILGMGAFGAGAALVPMTATIMVLMIWVTGRLVGRLGFRSPLVAGMLVLAGGITWLSQLGADGTYLADVLPASIVAAAGMALAYIPAMLAALSGARPEEGGLASGIVNTTYQIGSALGLAVVTAIAMANGAGMLGDPNELVHGFSAGFVSAAVLAAAGAGIAAIGLRRRRAVATPHTAAPTHASEGATAT
jgi:EmrB/QacA subfamily drug resistance transporter